MLTVYPAGSGKTILTLRISTFLWNLIDFSLHRSAIIDNLLQRFNSATAYFFFDGRDSQKDFQLHDKLIRSLIWQFSLKCEGKLPEVVMDLYTRCGKGHKEPTLDDLQHTLQRILYGFSSTFIILDALDECAEREKLLNWIKTVILEKDVNVGLHLMVTSRPEQDIKDKFKSHHHINLVKESGNHDLIAYLDYQLQNNSDLQKWNSDIQEQIKLTLMKQADGMYVYCQCLDIRIIIKCNFRFRWVVLQLNELKECRTKSQLRSQLADLPQGLDETYDRILLAIKKKDHDYAKIFLQWLCFAVRPLTLSELAATATVDLSAENEPEYKSDNELQDIKDVLQICSSLITKSEGMI